MGNLTLEVLRAGLDVALNNLVYMQGVYPQGQWVLTR